MPERPGMKSESPEYLAADIAAEAIDVSSRERAVFRALWLEQFRAIPDEGVAWIADRIARAGIPVSISQIQGFTQFSLQSAARVGTNVSVFEQTTSATYTDLSTTGPEITGLPDGTYAVFFGCVVVSSLSTHNAYAAPSFNGATPSDDESIRASEANVTTSFAVVEKTLSNGGNNSVKIQYRVDSGATGSYNMRSLAVLRVANA